MVSSVQQISAILYRNWKMLMSNKKKIIGNFTFPLIVTIMYYCYQYFLEQKSVVSFIFKLFLLIGFGMMNSSSIRQLVSLFVTQRQQKHRQYQMIMGQSYKIYTISHLLYIIILTTVYCLPFLLIVNYYNLSLITFFSYFSFLISSYLLALMLTSIFSDQKIAVEVIGIIFSFAAFLPLVHQSRSAPYFVNLLAEAFPNSSFALSLFQQDAKQRLKISSLSLTLVPIYVLIYWIIEYNDHFVGLIRKFNCRKQPKDGLMEQIQLETQSVFSQITQDSQMIGYKPQRTAITVKNITKKYGDTTALDDISLHITKSQIIGLLGRNGAGKTTLVDIITKVSKPTSGSIVFDDSIKNSFGRPSLGICYQQQILYQDLTPMAHLKYFSRLKGIQNYQQHIDQIVQKVGFGQHVHKKVKQLSGGSQRKLSVALALLGNPHVLIFDEPTSGLDPLSRRNIWSILEGLKQTQTTVLLTTHHLDQADYLSDRICVIQKGIKIIEDTPESIKHKYGQGYYLSIFFDEQCNQQQVKEQCAKKMSTMISQVLILEQGKDHMKYFIDSRVEFAKLHEIISQLQNIQNIRISLERNSLEQSFIAIIGEQENINFHENQDIIIRPRMEITFRSQIWGIFVKNCFCFVRKYYSIYCLTLIVFSVAIIIDIVLIKKFQTQFIEYQNQDDKPKNQIGISSIIILQIYILMTSSFITFPMVQKENKIISLLQTRGVNKFCYWLGQYIFDMIFFLVCFAIMRFFLASFLADCPYLLVFASGTGIILFAYSISLIFQQRKTANTWFTMINLVFFMVMMPIIIPGKLSQSNFYQYLSYIKYIYPYYDFGTYLIHHDPLFADLVQSMQPANTQQQYYIQYSILFYLFILIIVEGKVCERIFKKSKTVSCDDQILLQNLSKSYGSVQALKNVNYSVNTERVALLGHNGAGKSTTFGLLSSQINPTSGSLFIQGKLKKYHQSTLQSTGICFQNDTLWECLTPNDSFRIFSILLGLTDMQAERKELFNSLQFDYSKKKFEHLSGGNKRKLCMAICLMGQPQIRLLDECSTGLDPVSRLSMVKTIKKQRPGSTIFTTHSIPEAEDLCSRAIIMKDGSVSEDDKIYKLKEKHYNCFWIYITLNDDSSFMDTAQAIFKDFNLNHVNFNENKKLVELRKINVKLSFLMNHMHEAKINHHIKDFKIDQPKLEDVYLKITGRQNEEQLQFMQ